MKNNIVKFFNKLKINPILKSREYRWVQVITSITYQDQIVSLVGTTNNPDKTFKLKGLVDKHESQLKGLKIKSRSVMFMNSKGETSVENLSI